MFFYHALHPLQIGTTLDDAAGEAFDKVARLLGLPLTPSGGPALEALARTGDATRVPFSVPLSGEKGCDFSFSGLKSAARVAIERTFGEDLSDATLQVRRWRLHVTVVGTGAGLARAL